MYKQREKSEKEYIGKVCLDLSKYPGEDYYSDGDVEDELLQITRDLSAVEYPAVIEERNKWPILYHLSALRENIVDWVPLTKDMKVLEVGSGCGAITGSLARRAGSVTGVDLSKRRSTINAYRHSECDNVTICVGNYKDIEPTLPRDYDYIFLIGVFEYGISYIGGEHPFEDFLKGLLSHLKEGGRVVIAIENKYGLKYFAGCTEDHLGTYFSGIESYPDGGYVRTFSKNGLEEIFRACGANEYHFYYPYPDYKFMTSVYSDKRLPGKGELSNNMRNFDRDRMLLFDERNAFDGMVRDGLFPVFANSYVAVIGGELPVDYARYSNERRAEYAIRTEIGTTDNGVTYVRKYPMTAEAVGHVRNLGKVYELLSKRFEGGRLAIDPCTVVEENGQVYADLKYIPGRPLSELMDECLNKGDIEGFHRLFDDFLDRISYRAEEPVADFDMIFSNILVDGDTWTLIDYEWTVEQTIEVKKLAFRAIYCYILEDSRREKLPLEEILQKLHITPEEAEDYREKERKFQKSVTGDRLVMSELRNNLGRRIITPDRSAAEAEDLARRVQIYENCGEGYSEENSYFVNDAYVENGLIECDIAVSGNVHDLRIDPASFPCAVKFAELTFNGERIPIEKRRMLTVNGKLLPADKAAAGDLPGAVFATEDPNINLHIEDLNRRAENVLHVRLQIDRLSMPVAQAMAGAVRKIF